jgi:acetate kinase
MVELPRRILVLNAGSSSLKLGVFDWDTEAQLAGQSLAWEPETDASIEGHENAAGQLLAAVDLTGVCAIGHRVVHGGARYGQAVRLEGRVKHAIGELAPLAPLHNPAALAVIDATEQLLPGVPQGSSLLKKSDLPQQFSRRRRLP